MESHDIDRLRRSIVMLPPGHSAGALPDTPRSRWVEELVRLDGMTARYRKVIGELRRLLDGIEGSSHYWQ